MCMRMRFVPLVLVLALIASCAQNESEALPPGVTVSPDGTGYCCEPRRYASCSGFFPGGYGARPNDCQGRLSDLSWTPTTREFIDAHGCAALNPSTGMSCIVFDGGPADTGPVDAADIDSGP